MPKKKLIHFEENLTFPYLFQPKYPDLHPQFWLKSKWNSDFFYNSNPLVLEIGCGKGEYTVGLARKYPTKNFIGIDIKGARLWRGCRSVRDVQIKNIAFIRTLVDHVEKIFAPGEISEIWITFPDPLPKKTRRRFTAPWFLEKLSNILAPGGLIHLKTDNLEYYQFTLDTIADLGHKLLLSTSDLYHSGISGDIVTFQTFYEKMWLEKGKKICYICFQLNQS